MIQIAQGTKGNISSSRNVPSSEHWNCQKGIRVSYYLLNKHDNLKALHEGMV